MAEAAADDQLDRWQRWCAALAQEAETVSAEAEASAEPFVCLPLKLDPVVAMMQFFLDTGQLSRHHLAYQSMDRLLRGAAGMLAPGANEHHELRSFCETMKAVGGTAALHLLHGQGAADDPHTVGAGAERSKAPTTPAEHFARHNFGAFSVSAVLRHMPPHPAADNDATVVLPDVLNLFAACKKVGRAVSWAPAGDVQKRNISLTLTLDGMKLRVGTDFEQAVGDVWGFGSRVGLAEVRAYNAMTEPEQARWRTENPLVQEAVEVPPPCCLFASAPRFRRPLRASLPARVHASLHASLRPPRARLSPPGARHRGRWLGRGPCGLLL